MSKKVSINAEYLGVMSAMIALFSEYMKDRDEELLLEAKEWLDKLEGLDADILLGDALLVQRSIVQRSILPKKKGIK